MCYLFYLLLTSVKSSSQEAKGPISLSANIADMCIPSQVICALSMGRMLVFFGLSLWKKPVYPEETNVYERETTTLSHAETGNRTRAAAIYLRL